MRTRAVARGVSYIIGSAWSPPAEWKTNNSTVDGGRLLPDRYGSWATTSAAFADKIASNTDGTLYAMSPQHEPDYASCEGGEPCNGSYDSTVFSGAEMVDFMKVVGLMLREKGVVPMAPEPRQWMHLWSNESATGSEPGNENSLDPLACGFPAYGLHRVQRLQLRQRAACR